MDKFDHMPDDGSMCTCKRSTNDLFCADFAVIDFLQQETGH